MLSLVQRTVSKPEAPSVTSNPVAGPGPAPAATVWLVSFADEDDRELTPPEIAEALRRGQIDASTIVWREGRVDWAPLGTVEELAPLLAASGQTSGPPRVGSAEPVREIAERTKNPVSANEEPQPWKGKTRIGLPKVDTARKKPEAGPNPLSGSAAGEAKPEVKTSPIAAPSAAEPEQKKIAFKKVQPKAAEAKPATPKPSEATPTIPLVTTTALSAGTPTVPLAASKAARDAGVDRAKPRPAERDIWSTEDEAPISIELEPESVSPRSPAFSQVTSGAPGEPRKAAPKPPTPNRRPKPPPARSAESGGLSLQALAAPMASEPERVSDDIMNLGGGLTGLGGSLLAAPSIDVSALTSGPVESGSADTLDLPLLELPDIPANTLIEGTPTVPSAGVRPARKGPSPSDPKAGPSEKDKRRSSLPLVLGLVAAAIALAFVLRGKNNEDSASRTGTSATTSEVAPSAENAAVEAHPAEVPATPAPVAASAAPAAPAPTAGAPVAAVATAANHSTSSAATSNPTTKVATPHEEAARSSKPEEPARAETAKPAAVAAPPPQQQEVDVGGEFDKGAAIAALREAAAQASVCRKPGDPSGVADVHVTFSNSGRATNATVDGPPFAGTATGGCIAAALRRTKVPPFSGDRVTVTKHVVIN